MDPAVNVAACGAITALGRGLAPLERAVQANTVGLRACPRFTGKGYQTDVVGAVPEELWDEVTRRDPAHADARAFLLADDALRQIEELAREDLDRIAADRLGLVLSTTKAEITALDRLRAGSFCSETARRHLLPGLLAADLAAAHGAGGPVRCVSVACVSGLVALQLGADLIRRGAADAVLVVGVDLLSDFVMAGFTALKSLEPGGCRPFDKDRVGLSLGEGAARFFSDALRRLRRKQQRTVLACVPFKSSARATATMRII